jgi:hypothetical protein
MNATKALFSELVYDFSQNAGMSSNCQSSLGRLLGNTKGFGSLRFAILKSLIACGNL